jgi:hypothetical protein
MKRILSSVTSAAALLVTGLLAAAPARADTFNLTSCHVDGGCGTATSFGTVTVTNNGTGGVNFDVVLSDSNRFVQTGAGANALFLFNDSSSTAAITNPLTGMPANAVPGGLSGVIVSPPGVMADGTGFWHAGVVCSITANCNGGSIPTFQEITFTATNTTLAQVEAANAAGNIFVADVLIGSNGNTGPVDATPVPDGGMTVMLLGGALVALGSLRRKFRV